MLDKIPILVVAYNRPDKMAKVMQVIQEYMPTRLYLACDGPRSFVPGDAERVSETRKVIKNAINWECEKHYLYRDSNRGCAWGVYEAISWFFDNEEYGIIIEDDVIVSQDFFKLCEDLLPRYKDDNQIMQISSRNTSERIDIPNTYVYTQAHHCWGWATWRRAWRFMDMQMSGLKNLKLAFLLKRFGLFEGCMIYYGFHRLEADKVEQQKDWDTRWYLSVLCRDGLVICPGVNLGINIGMTEGEHYRESDASRPEAQVSMMGVTWPIVYNDTKLIDKKQKMYDNRFFMKSKLYGLVHKFIAD